MKKPVVLFFAVALFAQTSSADVQQVVRLALGRLAVCADYDARSFECSRTATPLEIQAFKRVCEQTVAQIVARTAKAAELAGLSKDDIASVGGVQEFTSGKSIVAYTCDIELASFSKDYGFESVAGKKVYGADQLKTCKATLAEKLANPAVVRATLKSVRPAFDDNNCRVDTLTFVAQ